MVKDPWLPANRTSDGSEEAPIDMKIVASITASKIGASAPGSH